ncbi:MAG: glycosyltransferase, partial [Clostridia bacterium]|nr:glycosyltransferase [Clostridia bacterium]
SEGFGLITAEAMFNKCLVVGNNNTGTKEQFDNGVEITGQEIGLRFNTSEELSDIMFNISSNGRNFYGHLIENAHRTVNQLYTVSNNGMAVYNYYKSIINKNI